ncbi:MAG: hypothetical protein JNL32_03500 [Candidatus Kapabacteria bacterium]|nr:hypothetical protein [Candidatus Kapabacteria bacterium]
MKPLFVFLLVPLCLAIMSCSSSPVIESFLLEGGHQMYYVRSVSLKGDDVRMDIDFTYQTKPGTDVTCNYTLHGDIAPRSVQGLMFITVRDSSVMDKDKFLRMIEMRDTISTENSKIIVLEEGRVRITSIIRRARFNWLMAHFADGGGTVQIQTTKENFPLKYSSRLDISLQKLNTLISAGDYK